MSSSTASLYISPPIFSTVPVNSNSSKVAARYSFQFVFSREFRLFLLSHHSEPLVYCFAYCLIHSDLFFLLRNHFVPIWTVADLESRTLETILPEYLKRCKRAWYVAVQSDCLHMHLLLNRFFRELQRPPGFVPMQMRLWFLPHCFFVLQ